MARKASQAAPKYATMKGMAQHREFEIGEWVRVRNRSGKWQVATKWLDDGGRPWYTLQGDEGNTHGAITGDQLAPTTAPHLL